MIRRAEFCEVEIHGRTADEISMADLLGQLFAYTEVFDMQTRPELILLQKSMVIVEGVARSLDPLVDTTLAQGWPLKRIEAILRAVLRAGAYELGHRNDVPARVVVSEYVDVAHAFVDRDETGLVNAVLDQIARQLRAAEFERVPR